MPENEHREEPMKKLILFALAACMMAAMAGCGSSTTAEPTPTIAPTPTVTPAPVDFIFSGPKNSAGTAVNALAEVYMESTGQNIQWKRTTVGTAMAYTITDKTDIALVTREIKQEELDLYEGLQSTLLCNEAIAIVAGANCPIDDISVAQLQEIFNGDTYDWADFGGSGVIPVYGFSSTTSVGEAFEALVLGFDETGTQVTLNDSLVTFVDTTDDLASLIESDELAIGFMPLSLAEKYSMKVLKVDGVTASEETVKNGTYPLQRPFYMVTVGEVPEMVQTFIDYCTTEAASKNYLEELGYIVP